jgi:hypothetical protein
MLAKAKKIEERKKAIADSWDPTKLEDPTGDPYKTLFIANLVYAID